MCAQADDPSQHGQPWASGWTPEQIEEAKAEAIAHGHPSWSHAVAHGPCTRPSKFDQPRVIEDPADLAGLVPGEYVVAGRARDEILRQQSNLAMRQVAQMEAAELFDLEDTLVEFVKYLHRESSIQGSIDPDPLVREFAHEFLATRPDLT